MLEANNALENDATRVFLALDRSRVESQIQKILERDLAGKFYKGRGSSEQARAAIGDALRQQGATEEQIHQVLSGKVGRLIDATDVFHKDWLKADRTSDGIYVSCRLNDPSYLSQGLNLMSAAALALDECAREHPHLTQLTLSSIELAMGGVAGYIRTRVGDAVGLNDYVDGKIHQAESWLSSQLEGSLGMSAQKADMLASAGTFGIMFGFAGVVGNAKDKILKKAEDVTGKVKASLTPSRTRDVPTTKTSLDSLGLEGRAGRSTKPVRDMSDREYVQSLADRADKRFEGKGPRVGTQKHKYAEQVHKRYQRMTGERQHIEAEKRFSKGRQWEEGMDVKGSSRADIVKTK